ncbi:hypothetical protein AB0C34_18400 [Nocardia sp. NPDC049220]
MTLPQRSPVEPPPAAVPENADDRGLTTTTSMSVANRADLWL